MARRLVDLRRLAELRHRSSCCRSLQRRRELVESFQALCGSSASSRYSRRNRPGRMLAARTSRGWPQGSVAGGLCRVLERTASRSRRTWAATTTWLVSLTINYAKEVLEAHLQASEVSQMRLMPGCTLGLTFVPPSRQDMPQSRRPTKSTARTRGAPKVWRGSSTRRPRSTDSTCARFRNEPDAVPVRPPRLLC